jgi:hypothetical protein
MTALGDGKARHSVSRRWVFAALTFVLGISLLRALRSRYRARRSVSRQVAQAMDGLDEAELRGRFRALAQEFRLTHAGAGRPALAGDGELERFLALGLVESVKRPHVAAGMLEIYKLTALGESVDAQLARQDRMLSRPARPRAIGWPPALIRRGS